MIPNRSQALMAMPVTAIDAFRNSPRDPGDRDWAFGSTMAQGEWTPTASCNRRFDKALHPDRYSAACASASEARETRFAY